MGRFMEKVNTGRLGKPLEASYTVEAALVMAVTLFLMASLLTEAFRIHSQVTADMVLQNALEQAGNREEGVILEEILEKGNRGLQGYFRCSDKQINIKEKGKRMEGAVTGSSDSLEHRISVKIFDPEGFLRLIRAIGI